MASLIKTSAGKVPGRAVQFVDQDGRRRTIRLGACGLELARRFKTRVEVLLSCAVTNSPPDLETSAWLAGLPTRMHAKLSAFGLASPREPEPTSPTLSSWLAKYLEQCKGVLKPKTLRAYTATAAKLVRHLGPDLTIGRIDREIAADWRAWLVSTELAEGSVRHHCRQAKALFAPAVERGLLDANPFQKLKSATVSAERDRYVTPEETDDVLEACPDLRWRVLFGLARLAGLRVPSETHLLNWGDMDWKRGRLSVFSPKCERFESHRRRSVPIVPKLMAILQDAFDAAELGEEGVVQLSRNNLPRGMAAILKRAGVEPWKDLFNTLRASCDTELKLRFPGHAVDKWLGHSKAISEKHYLMVPDHVWDEAAGLGNQGAAECAAVSPRIGSQGVATAKSNAVTQPHETPCFPASNAPKGTAPPGIRTPDPLIKSQQSLTGQNQPKALSANNLPQTVPSGKNQRAAECAADSDDDPSLAALIAAWPHLPDPARIAITMIVESAGPSPTPTDENKP